MLDLIHANKSFKIDGGKKFVVLEDINLSAKEGEFVCILGPSGCGKTVLLYLIAGFLESTSGKILMNGEPINGSSRDRVMVFQDYVLFPWKTVYGNVMFGLNKLEMGKQEKREIVMKYLELVGLVDFKDWYVHKLSGGMQQKVALARALAVNPKILLMDEPFSALDAPYRRHLRLSLEDIWKKTKKTIILVTHNVDEAIHLADRIYLLSASPARVKNIYEVNLPRYRRSFQEGFIELSKKIKFDMADSFVGSVGLMEKNKLAEESLENLLKNSDMKI